MEQVNSGGRAGVRYEEMQLIPKWNWRYWCGWRIKRMKWVTYHHSHLKFESDEYGLWQWLTHEEAARIVLHERFGTS